MELSKKTIELCLEMAKEKCKYFKKDISKYQNAIIELEATLEVIKKFEQRRKAFDIAFDEIYGKEEWREGE